MCYMLLYTIWVILHGEGGGRKGYATLISQDGSAGVRYSCIKFLTEEDYTRERVTRRKTLEGRR